MIKATEQGRLYLGEIYSKAIEVMEDKSVIAQIGWPWAASQESIKGDYRWHILSDFPVWANGLTKDIGRFGTVKSCNFHNGLGSIVIEPAKTEAALETLSRIEKGGIIRLRIEVTYWKTGVNPCDVRPEVISTIPLRDGSRFGGVYTLI